MTTRTRVILSLLVAAAVLAAIQPAMACPVCWGASDSPMAQGMNNGVLFLLAVIGAVQVGFVALFVSFRRRGKAIQERTESFEVIDGGCR